MPTDELRAHPRFHIGTRVNLVLSGQREPVRPELVDLCGGGCYLTPLPEVQTGWPVSLAFTVDGRPCRATGSVVRIDEWGVAIQIATKNESMEIFLLALKDADDDRRRQLVSGITDGEIQVG